jgi:hypothetical protein
LIGQTIEILPLRLLNVCKSGEFEMEQSKCDQCLKLMPSYDTVHYGSIEGGYRLLCSQCFNAKVAKRSGISDFENIQLEPISLSDCDGLQHEFHFRIRLLGTFLSLTAFELRDQEPGGYRFEILGEPECDVLALLGQLVEKIRCGLDVKQLTVGANGPQMAANSVVGRIEWDESENGELPLVVIDGKAMSWADFGRMLTPFEGFQFQMNIGERSDEL